MVALFVCLNELALIRVAIILHAFTTTFFKKNPEVNVVLEFES